MDKTVEDELGGGRTGDDRAAAGGPSRKNTTYKPELEDNDTIDSVTENSMEPYVER